MNTLPFPPAFVIIYFHSASHVQIFKVSFFRREEVKITREKQLGVLLRSRQLLFIPSLDRSVFPPLSSVVVAPFASSKPHLLSHHADRSRQSVS
jgi:hypothetical protein